MESARADDVRVVLDGIEGDIAVSHGDGYLVELAYNGEWDRLMAVATPFADRQGFPLGAIIRQYGARVWPLQLRRGHIGRVADGLRALGPAQDMGATRLLWRYGIKPVLPGPAQRIWNRLRGAPDQPSRLERLIAPALRSRTQFVERKQHLEAPAETITTERDAHIYTLTNGVATQFLEEGDHFAAALGVERRHPFYDVRLLEYCVGLPPDCKMRDGWTRYILRRALRDKLPSRVRRRTSKGRLRANFARNLLEMNTGAVERLISGEDAERVAPYVSIDALAEAQGRGDAEMLWAGLQLATWLRQVEEMS
jgi:asparagine synthase (glutamine-hydrolysing)